MSKGTFQVTVTERYANADGVAFSPTDPAELLRC